MLLPIGDQPSPRGTAVVNVTLVLFNVLLFLLITVPLSSQAIDPNLPGAVDYIWRISHSTGEYVAALLEQLSAYDLYVYEHGFRPEAPGLKTLFFSMFLHAGWMHLLGNMLFLWIFGDNVETRLGRLGYLLSYLGTGAVATLFHALLQWGSPLPMIGASGAISGVLGLYFVWFPENRVRMFLFLYWYVDVFLVPARWVLGFYLLVENLLPFLLGGGVGSIAYSAHIGGFVAGVVLAHAINFFERRREAGQPGSEPLEDEQLLGEEGEAARSSRVHRALRQGNPELAVRGYFELHGRERARLSAAQVLAMGDWLMEQNRPDVALTLFQQFLSTHPRDPGAAAVHVRCGLIRLYRHGRPTDAYQHLADAMRLGAPAELHPQIDQALADIERLQRLQGQWVR
jgi:membrane associated rhomboid family serine protease